MEAILSSRTRAVVGVVSALLVIAALWGSDLVSLYKNKRPPPVTQTAHKPASPIAIPPANVSSESVRPVQTLAGTDSSVSPQPHQLILSGVIPGRSHNEGSAMIGTTKENPQTYSAGAVLANGARLTEVHEKYVILERNGQTAHLYLQSLSNQKADAQLSDILTVGGRKRLPIAKATNIEPITDYLRPSPVYDGSTLRGFEVYAGQKSGAFSQMGLKGGDVITALEGTPLSEPAQAFELFGQLMDGVALSATVLRNGKTENLVLDGVLIVADRDRTLDHSFVSQSTSR
jgi:type II secretion system protein C